MDHIQAVVQAMKYIDDPYQLHERENFDCMNNELNQYRMHRDFQHNGQSEISNSQYNRPYMMGNQQQPYQQKNATSEENVEDYTKVDWSDVKWVSLKEYGELRKKFQFRFNLNDETTDIFSNDSVYFDNFLLLEDNFNRFSVDGMYNYAMLSPWNNFAVQFPSFCEQKSNENNSHEKISKNINKKLSRTDMKLSKRQSKSHDIDHLNFSPDNKKKKRKKSPLCNRPMTSFFKFFMANRKKIQKSVKISKDVTKEAGRLWRELPQSKKNYYNKMAAEDFKKWKEQMNHT